MKTCESKKDITSKMTPHLTVFSKLALKAVIK